MILNNTGLETHPVGTSNPNGIITENWWTVNEMFNPASGKTASQSGTTVTASSSIFTAADASSSSIIRWKTGQTATISAYTNGTTVTVTGSQTVASGAFFIYRTGQAAYDALIRGLTKQQSLTLAQYDMLQWDGAKVVGISRRANANQATLTNSSGGSYSTTVSTVGNTSSGDQSGTINNNFATIVTVVNEILAVLVNSHLAKGSA